MSWIKLIFEILLITYFNLSQSSVSAIMFPNFQTSQLVKNEQFNSNIIHIFNQSMQKSLLNVSQECNAKLDLLLTALDEHQKWSIQVIDSFGKPSSGILHGTFRWLGEFNQCKRVRLDSFTAKYCVAKIRLAANSSIVSQQLFFI
jgi:hypothetical protein